MDAEAWPVCSGPEARTGGDVMTDIMKGINPLPCVNALKAYGQADMDGVMCVVSRQAVHEAIDILDNLYPKLVEALERADKTLNQMADTAFKVGLQGTKDWDDVAGGADLFGASDEIRALLAKCKAGAE